MAIAKPTADSEAATVKMNKENICKQIKNITINNVDEEMNKLIQIGNNSSYTFFCTTFHLN